MKAHLRKPSTYLPPVEQDHLPQGQAERGPSASVTAAFLPVGPQDEDLPASSGPASPPHVRRYVTEMIRHPRYVGAQRRIVAAFLRHWAAAAADAVHSITLVVSELLSNAVRYGRAEAVGLSLAHDSLSGKVRIEVDDRTPGSRAEPCGPDVDREGGRGLFLVDALTEAWGVSEDGSITWCTIDMGTGDGR